jgi:PIN domain nuclease of toxin-antitoxin system
MLCYGMTNMATKFEIDVIELKEDYLHPDLQTLLPYLNQYQLSSTSFWEAMVKTQIAHVTLKPSFNARTLFYNLQRLLLLQILYISLF